MLEFWLLIVLLILLIAGYPGWPYSQGWGYGPAGIIVALLLAWLIVIWLGYVAFAWPWVAPPATTVPPPTTSAVPAAFVAAAGPKDQKRQIEGKPTPAVA